MRHVHTITQHDVGRTHLRVGGRLRDNPLGVVLSHDVGKRVYDADGVLQVENDEQRDRRMGRRADR